MKCKNCIKKDKEIEELKFATKEYDPFDKETYKDRTKEEMVELHIEMLKLINEEINKIENRLNNMSNIDLSKK